MFGLPEILKAEEITGRASIISGFAMKFSMVGLLTEAAKIQAQAKEAAELGLALNAEFFKESLMLSGVEPMT